MPPHVRRRRARCRSNTPRHAVSARADLSLGRSQRLMKAKCVALIDFCKRLWLKGFSDPKEASTVSTVPSSKRTTVSEAAHAHNQEQLLAFRARLMALEPAQFEH